jgi:hypothetical protein
MKIKTKIVSCHTADSKPVKQEVNSTAILPPLVFPDISDKKFCNHINKMRGISCQFLLSGGSIGPRYVWQLLFSEKSQNC